MERRLSAASEAASSQRRRVGRKIMAGNKLYEPRAASNVAGGISGMRSFMFGAQASMPAVRRHPAGPYPDRKRCEQDAREPLTGCRRSASPCASSSSPLSAVTILLVLLSQFHDFGIQLTLVI